MALFMDVELARRLERTEGAVGASFLEASLRVRPEPAGAWHDFDGIYAIFDGIDSPMTQTFGLGLHGPVTPASVSAIEAFFEARGTATVHEVSPLAEVATHALLVDRGYRPIELSTVLMQELPPRALELPTSSLRVRLAEPADRDAWIETSVTGWSQDPEITLVIRSLSEIAFENRSMLHFLIERDGAPVATASLGVHEGVALLAGASTIPSARGLGAQALLLAARLAEAHRRGCALAMMVTAVGSTSQRNSERRGFRIAYTRSKWRRPLP